MLKKFVLALLISSIVAPAMADATDDRLAKVTNLTSACVFLGEAESQFKAATLAMAAASKKSAVATGAYQKAVTTMENLPITDYALDSSPVQNAIARAIEARRSSTRKLKADANINKEASEAKVASLESVVVQAKALAFAYGGICKDTDGNTITILVKDFAPLIKEVAKKD